MSINRRQLLGAIGGAGFLPLIAVGAEGRRSQRDASVASAGVKWDQPVKLTAEDGDGFDYFGSAVTLSGDGRTALISADGDEDPNGFNSGAAYVFTWDGSAWGQQAKLTAEDGDKDDVFGSAVALSADGTTALVGAENDEPTGVSSGSAYVFTQSGESWTEQAKLTPGDESSGGAFGKAVALSGDGSTAVVGVPGEKNANGVSAGSAHVFKPSNGSWTRQTRLLADDGAASDEFGSALALTADGSLVLVGTPRDDTNGDRAGAVYAFARADGAWSQQTKLVVSNGQANEFFGASLALTVDGQTAVVGAPGSPGPRTPTPESAYVFGRSSGSWSQQANLAIDDGDDRFGNAVAVTDDGTTALVAAKHDEDPNGTKAGAVYVFSGASGSWSNQKKLTASDGDSRDLFGTDLALSSGGTTALVGADGEESPNGDRRFGAAYVSGTVPEQETGDTAATGTTSGQSTATPASGTATGTQSGTATSTSSGSGPGFGLAGSLSSLVGAGYLLQRYRDDEYAE